MNLNDYLNILFESKIDFPKNEYISIKKDLKENKIVNSIRVDKEYNQYKKGQIYSTPFKFNIIIVDVIKLKNIKEYKYFKSLSNTQIAYLEKFDKLDWIKFKKEG